MNSAFLMLVFLLPGTDPEPAPPSAPAVAEGYALPEPNFPLPLPSTHPECGGLILGRHFGGLCGSFWQCGWKQRDGSSLLVCWKSLGHLLDVSFFQPIYQNETFRETLGRFASISEWYIGYGLSVRLDLGGLAGPMRVVLAWYPTQGTSLELGWVLGSGYLDGGILVLF